MVQASKKSTDKRLKWYGHVRRMEEEHIVRRRHTRGKKIRTVKPKIERCV